MNSNVQNLQRNYDGKALCHTIPCNADDDNVATQFYAMLLTLYNAAIPYHAANATFEELPTHFVQLAQKCLKPVQYRERLPHADAS